jgi:hypothetical protein
MKKVQAFILFIVLGTIQALAQPSERQHRDFSRDMIHHLDSIVTLTDDQKSSIEKLQIEFRANMRERHQNSDRPDRRKMMEMKKEQHHKIMELLTPEQKELVKASKEGVKEEMKKMQAEIKTYRNEQIKPAIENLRSDFNEKLSDVEKAKIQEVNLKVKQMKKDLKVSKDSLPEGEKSIGEMQKNKDNLHHKGISKEAHKEIRDYVKTELQSILEIHSQDLDKVMEDLKPLKATWEADMKNIKTKYGMRVHGNKAHGDKGLRKEHKRRKGKMRHHHKRDSTQQKSEVSKIRFLLSADGHVIED